jgi:hypothetical protein
MNDDHHSAERAILRAEIRLLRTALNRQTANLAVLLKRRGFTIYKKEPVDKLFIPPSRFRTGFYRKLHKYSFRLFLRDVILHQEQLTPENVSRYVGPNVAAEYLAYLRLTGLVRKKAGIITLSRCRVKSFGETLEWYVAELFKREFGSEAVRGVKFKRPKVGGDYDVIARIGESLVYIEVKSSPPKQIFDSEIIAFLDRVSALAPDVSIFFMDTELRMKDKLVPMFRRELRGRGLPPKVQRIDREIFAAGTRIFIMNAKENILRNFESVLSFYYQENLKGIT